MAKTTTKADPKGSRRKADKPFRWSDFAAKPRRGKGKKRKPKGGGS